MFNKKRNDERDRPEASYNEASPEPNEPIIQAEPDMQVSDPDPAQYANGSGGVPNISTYINLSTGSQSTIPVGKCLHLIADGSSWINFAN